MCMLDKIDSNQTKRNVKKWNFKVIILLLNTWRT